MQTIIETERQSKNVHLLLKLFNELIAPKQGPESLDRCQPDCPVRGTLTGNEGYMARFKIADYGDGLAQAGYLIVYHLGQHSGNFHENGLRLLIIARDFREDDSGKSGIVYIPSVEEVAVLPVDVSVVFLEVIAKLSLFKGFA